MNQPIENITIALPVDDYEIEQMMAVRVSAAEVAYSKPDWPDMRSVREHYSEESRIIAEGIRLHKLNALCAKAGPFVVGMCVWSEIDAANARIDYLYILPEFQGQTIGGILFETALQRIGDARTVQLTTQSAQKFYERKGFVGTNEFVVDDFTSEEIMTRTSESA